MSKYIGNQPLTPASYNRKKFMAVQGQTTFLFDYQPGFVEVYINGVLQATGGQAYTADNGNSIVLTEALNLGDIVECVGLNTFTPERGSYILVSPNGTRYSLTVDNTGNLNTQAL